MSRKFLNGIDLQSQKIINLADPSSATDGVTKQYADNLIRGAQWKDPVRAATTTNGTLASAYANGSTVDGVTLATNDRILLKNQTTGSENGIYTVNASGAPTRAVDADGSGEIKAGLTVYVTEGTTNADKAFALTTDGTITIGTTSLTFGQIGGGTSYSAGNGITLTSTTFSVNLDSSSGLVVSGTGLKIDNTIVVRKYATNVGDGSATSYTKAHGLGTADLTVAVYLIGSPSELVEVDVTVDSTNVYLVFASAPASNAYRLVAHG